MRGYATSAGYEITEQTARDLSRLLGAVNMERVGGRLWREVLNDDDKRLLGGRFAASFCRYGRMIGIYRELNPRVSTERAILEVLHELGMLASPCYRRLVIAIGERPDMPPDTGTRPVWNASLGQLVLRGLVIRHVRQPGRAFNIVALLDAFERLAWPRRVPLNEIKTCPTLLFARRFTI